MKNSSPPIFINSYEALYEFIRTLNCPRYIALDTEFMREKTYFPQLCLIQIESEGTVACIDTIAINKNELHPLINLIKNQKTTKILHGATQDLEIFYHLCDSIPSPIFDTQIAAGLLGQGNQIGYAPLTELLLGIKIDKSQSRTDWSQRPLSNEQLAYAANDVRFLHKIYHIQAEQLAVKGRNKWLEEDTHKLYDAQRYVTAPHDAWHKIKNTSTLNKKQLATLQELSTWRENTAIKKNLPRRWIMSDEALIEAAKTTVHTVKTPESSITDNEKASKQPCFYLTKNNIKALKKNTSHLKPRHIHSNNLTADQKTTIQFITKKVHICAVQNDITPEQILTRKQIEAIVKKEKSFESIGNWRSELLGPYVINELHQLLIEQDPTKKT
ncbi:ribonuclease D [Plasticicumulans acidivorans]|uniref:Ribonuclease D n=1 Tax=Plasticicumulans acidivorans TaxID=886464 RepID=A0A317MWA2_9GAMM|nr:ribonuclease D [Plasticicumulans acidivorans]PWV61749.1 ribonuclease D [Plasticicumulans acidivorans]